MFNIAAGNNKNNRRIAANFAMAAQLALHQRRTGQRENIAEPLPEDALSDEYPNFVTFVDAAEHAMPHELQE